MSAPVQRPPAGVGRTGLEEYVRRLVDEAPPLTKEQRARLDVLLRPGLHVPRAPGAAA